MRTHEKGKYRGELKPDWVSLSAFASLRGVFSVFNSPDAFLRALLCPLR